MATETQASTSSDWQQEAKDLLLHNHAEALKTARAVERQARGVDDVSDQPWRATTTTINQGGGGWLQTALLGGAILAAGGIPLLASGLAGSKPGAAPVQPAPVVAQPPASLGSQAFDEVVEEKQADGSWREIDRQPFGTFPKGPKP